MCYDRMARDSELQGQILILGDCSNIEHHVNRESFIWEDLRWEKDLLLQRNRIWKTARILTRQGIQIANGSLAVMEEKAERLTSGEFLRRGDVIGVSRGLYEHFALWCKTGIAVSSQVRNFVEAVIPSRIDLRGIRESRRELCNYLAG